MQVVHLAQKLSKTSLHAHVRYIIIEVMGNRSSDFEVRNNHAGVLSVNANGASCVFDRSSPRSETVADDNHWQRQPNDGASRRCSSLTILNLSRVLAYYPQDVDLPYIRYRLGPGEIQEADAAGVAAGGLLSKSGESMLYACLPQ